MRAISSGLAGGSSLALAWKALQVLDRPAAIADPHLVCEAFCPKPVLLDWFSFTLGLLVGVATFAIVEFVVTLRWVLVASFRPHSEHPGDGQRGLVKPLYKVL